jgi:hypothetical protein
MSLVLLHWNLLHFLRSLAQTPLVVVVVMGPDFLAPPSMLPLLEVLIVCENLASSEKLRPCL